MSEIRPPELPLKWLEKALPTLIIVYIAVFATSILDSRLSFESYWFGDMMFQSRKLLGFERAPSGSIAFVDLDDQSYRQLRTAVMDRKEHMAPVMEALHDVGVRHAVLDIEFFDPVRPRLDVDAAERLLAGMEPLVETLSRITTTDEFERQGEVGMALEPLKGDLRALTEDPNEAFARSLNMVGGTLGVHCAPSQKNGQLILVAPEDSLARRLDPKSVSWGLVNAASSEDGLVRTVRPLMEVDGRHVASLGMSAYLADHRISMDQVSLDPTSLRIGDLVVPLMDSGEVIIDWNSRLEAPSLRVPFVRLHDLKTAERAARMALHAAMALDEKEYTRLTGKGDYLLRRKGTLDPVKGSLGELETGIGRFVPLEPMKALSEGVLQKLEETRGHLKDWRERQQKLSWLKDKVVFLGAAGTSSIDRRPSPISPDTPMVTLHAAVFNSLSLGSQVCHPPVGLEALGAVLFLSLLALAGLRSGPKMVAVVTLGLSSFVSTLGFILFMQGWLLRSGGSSIEAGGWLITGITSALNLISFKRRQFVKERDSHLTRSAIERVRQAPEGDLEGAARLTVLHLTCGELPPSVLARGAAGVREHVSGLQQVIKSVVEVHGGVPEKFDGQGLAVFFGAVLPGADPALRAWRCARELKDHLAKIGGTDLPPRLGFGIGTGEALYGTFGSTSRYDLTVVGVCAETARRLSAASFQSDSSILMDEATRASGLPTP